MKASRHLVMIIVALITLSLLCEHAQYIRTAQTIRTILSIGVILWLAFLAICHDQQQLNNTKQARCDMLLAEQRRMFEESIELINLSRVRYRQEFLVPKEHNVVFDTIFSSLEDSRALADKLSLALLRAHHLNVVHEMLVRHEKPLRDLYIAERQREYELMPHRVLIRLNLLRKKISFFEAYSLVPELKKIHVLLQGRHNPDLMRKQYGEQWKLYLISEIERLICGIEAELFNFRKPNTHRPI